VKQCVVWNEKLHMAAISIDAYKHIFRLYGDGELIETELINITQPWWLITYNAHAKYSNAPYPWVIPNDIYNVIFVQHT
jgi:hypothetical protein